MSKWIRNYDPSEIDGDEWGHILIMRDNGIKSVYHWQDFVNDDATAEGYAWQPLPKSDVPESISITIERGDRSWTIENNGFTIEIHDSRDPMGQPTVHEVTVETGANMNAMFAEAVLSVLESKDEDEDWCECEGEGVVVNDTVLQGFLDAIRGNETEDNCYNELDILKKSELSYTGVVESLRRRISHLESGSETASVPASKPKPWQKNRGKPRQRTRYFHFT